MKKIFVIFALFAALIFVVSCGGGSTTGDNTDTGTPETDEDSVDSGSTDTGTTEPTDTGTTEPTDTGTTEPTDTGEPDTAPVPDEDNADSGDSAPDQDADSGDSGVIEQMEEGIYLGIIGFNYQLNIRDLSYLTNSNMTEFQDFIDDFEMDDGTALYFADYTALKMMRDYTPAPPKLQTVALVTFTDGEDTSSDGPVNDPENYNDPDVYLNAIHNKIMTNGIHGLSVEAYSIGLRSGDTGSDFKSKLEKLASSSDKAFEVSDMEEVQERFTKIAEDLYSVFKTINIDFKVLGNYSDGTRMRFSLDIYCDHDENECEKNGKNSNLYIDATYRRNGNERSFENFAYYGFSGNLTTVNCGERDQKGFYPCRFENLKYDNMDTEIKQIELWKNDNSEWKHENEALKQGDSNINESKSSALIMLVLDCTTSLGNTKFKKLQEAGKDFIETLVNGGSGVTTTPCDPNPCSGIDNSNGSCTPSGTNYVCGCNSGYNWTGSQCQLTKSLGEICTGQTSCYNKSSPITCPTSSSQDFFGQDAYYASLGKCTAQSFSSSTNVVVDNNTGLTWEKSPSSSTYTWANANNHCANLNSSNYGGKSNWRVPNPLELLTIVNNSTYNPATNSNFTNMPTSNSTYLWTNNEYKGNTSYAYYFSPSYGWYLYDDKTATYKVLCVSGNEMPKGVFSSQTISGSVVVTDSTTGLMWQKEYGTGKTWQEALKYCEDSTYAGYSDWRLPNKNELSSLLDPGKSGAPYSNFPDMPTSDPTSNCFDNECFFWSSSTTFYEGDVAWAVFFDFGTVKSYGGDGGTFKSNPTGYYRCVR